jgi:PAS domain S-box-containing protein|tara:strand:- start:2949 stop:6536 length:3588 start_codon:yes stop_codon:yes gene_type:complete
MHALLHKLKSKKYRIAQLAPLCFVLWLCTLSREGLALSLADQRNLMFDHLDTSHGLSNIWAKTLIQDHNGFIWIGTEEGLNRFDGYRFEHFFHRFDDPNTLSGDYIWDLLEDRNGNLWVLTANGLNRFNPQDGNFERIVHSVESRTGGNHDNGRELLEDSAGHLWIGSEEGLCRMESDGSFSHFIHDPVNPNSIGEGFIRAILEDSKGRFWVGTDKGGLSLLDRDSGTFFRYSHDPDDPQSLSGSSVRFILEADDGLLWVGTYTGGLSILNPETGRFTRWRHDPYDISTLSTDRLKAIVQDKQGHIWIGTGVGIDLWRPESKDFQRFSVDPGDAGGTRANEVMDLYQDDGGVIWAGTVNGISKWNANITYFPHTKHQSGKSNGLLSDSITSFAEDGLGNIWIGTEQGLSRWDKQSGHFSHIRSGERGLSGEYVMSLLSDSQARLWVGTRHEGLNLLLPGTTDFQVLHHDATRIYEDSRGIIWVATYGDGLLRYNEDGSFSRYPESLQQGYEFSDLKVLDIVEDEDGILWLATQGGGLTRFQPASGKTTHLRHQPEDSRSLSSDKTLTLLRTEDSIWVGTMDEGLNRFNAKTGSFTHYDKTDGLSSNVVFGLLEDNMGRIWVSGGYGLSVLDLQNNQTFVYDTTHGLQNSDFTHLAHLKTSDGNFLFGGFNGFNAFDPLKTRANTYVPPVKLTRFTKFNKSFDLGVPPHEIKSLQLDYSDYVIGFEFAAMDFTAPQNNAYRYMLDGFDRNWVEARDVHQATYTNLPAGNYTFRVLGSNNDGVWNDEGLTIDINVSPPLWATWWAYTGYLLIAVALLYRFQQAQAERLKREAEKRYNERLQLYIESLEEASDCVLIADANQQLMYANNAISALMGIEPDSARGQPMLDLLFHSERDAANATVGLTTDGRWHGEVNNQRGQEKYTAETTLATVKDSNDNPIAYVGIARDITDRKLTEAELANYRRNLEQLVDDRTEALSREVVEHKSARENLANSLREKELLLKEVHHRVKNNMQIVSSLLNIQAESVEDNRFTSLLKASQQRIKSMAMIHENLYQSESLVEIDFHDYIQSLANSLCRLYTSPGITIHLDIGVDDVNLDIDTAVPCGLIINELISNALKHAYDDHVGSGTIGVYFRKTNGCYELTICDDGRGMPEDFDFNNTQSMGMEIVCILTEQLEGEIEYHRGKGSRFTIKFQGR